METVYYNLQAKRMKVSGGADLVTFLPASAPAPGHGGGEVLDFARCRRRLETKAAWKELRQAALSPAEEAPVEAPEEAPAPRPHSSRRERAAGWLEIAASAAVIAVSLAAVLAFLRLL